MTADPNRSLFIRDAAIVDGTGGPSRSGAVLVRDGKIAAVEEGASAAAPEGARVIDAKGKVVAPGFIDVHTHFDPQICWDRLATPSIEHGVTMVECDVQMTGDGHIVVIHDPTLDRTSDRTGDVRSLSLAEVQAAVTASDKQRHRLALWSRRLLGEAITQAQYVMAEHDELADLVLTSGEGLTQMTEFFDRLQHTHSTRMHELGLA